MTFEELKNHSKESGEATVAATTKQVSKKDPRFWEPTIKDKDTKISSAVIRPISCVASEKQNVVVITSHFLKRNGKNYSFACPKTINGRCPVCESYWSKPYGQRDVTLRPKKKWLMNIYVVDDRSNPENNGKVFLWAAPKTIWDKIEAARNAEYKEEKVDNIFDMWEGASILVRTKDKAGFINYEDSTIRPADALFKDLPENDPKYIEVAMKAYPLSEFVTPSAFKSYSEIESILNEANTLVDTRPATAPGNYIASKNLEDTEEEKAAALEALKEVEKNTEVVTTDDENFFDDIDM